MLSEIKNAHVENSAALAQKKRKNKAKKIKWKFIYVFRFRAHVRTADIEFTATMRRAKKKHIPTQANNVRIQDEKLLKKR